MTTRNINEQLRKDIISRKTENVKAWGETFNYLVDLLRAQISRQDYKAVYGDFNEGICPYISFITIDALKKEDWPNNINRNSIYITFKIDQIAKKVSIFDNGHVWISDKDKEVYPKDKYLAMHSMTNITKRNGGKVMRKSSYKDVNDLAKKIITAFENVMKEVKDYTGGYPYKQGIKALKTE